MRQGSYRGASAGRKSLLTDVRISRSADGCVARLHRHAQCCRPCVLRVGDTVMTSHQVSERDRKAT